MTAERPLRAAIIGLGRMGSTYDDETGPYGFWQPPHTHAEIECGLPATHVSPKN